MSDREQVAALMADLVAYALRHGEMDLHDPEHNAKFRQVENNLLTLLQRDRETVALPRPDCRTCAGNLIDCPAASGIPLSAYSCPHADKYSASNQDPCSCLPGTCVGDDPCRRLLDASPRLR